MTDPFSGGIMPQVIQNRQGLQNLQAQQQEMQRLQQQQQMQDEGMRLLEQYQAGLQQGKPDQSLLYSAVLKSPTAAQNVLNAVGIVDKQQKTQAATDVVTLMSAIDNPQAFFKAVAQRSAAIKARGGDPSDTLEMAKRYQAGDVTGVKNDLMIAGAALANEGLLKPELIGLGGGAEPMTAYQQASTDLKRQELELRRQEKATETQLKVLEARMKKEDNELKRQDLQLKIDEQKQKLDDARRGRETASNEKEAGLESARMNIDNMLNSVSRVMQTPLDVIENATGPVDQMIPTLRQSTADFEELVETLGSQAFLSQIPLIKGMGQLSNAEGEKLQAAFQNFSLRQSPERLMENLKEGQRLLLKARSNIAKQYGKPESKPDVPSAELTDDDIMKQYGLQ